jgi:hypothetical protein
MDNPQRYKLIACEILFREVCFCAAQSRNIVDVTFMPKGLHDIGQSKMSARLQAEIDQIDASQYAAILFGYGLCNNGTQGLRAPIPMVVPRAHDCITLLMGSKDKYAAYFQDHPGTFYKSPGWIERDRDPNDNPDSVMTQLGISRTYQDYVAKYGEENARYLMEMLGDWVKNYNRMTYIDTQVGNAPLYRAQSRADAEQLGWEYDEIQGSLDLLMRLLNGEWNAHDFLVIPPSQTLIPTYDDQIMGSV